MWSTIIFDGCLLSCHILPTSDENIVKKNPKKQKTPFPPALEVENQKATAPFGKYPKGMFKTPL